jgi:hypothetical protein
MALAASRSTAQIAQPLGPHVRPAVGMRSIVRRRQTPPESPSPLKATNDSTAGPSARNRPAFSV